MGRKPDIPAAKKEPGALNRVRWCNYRKISRLEEVWLEILYIHGENSDQSSLQSNSKGKRKITQRINRIVVRKLLEDDKATFKKV